MKDKDKIFIIFYLNVSKIAIEYVKEYINHLGEGLRFDETVSWVIVPVNEESRVVCINPVLLDEEKYKEVEKTIEEAKKKFEEALKDLEK